MISKPSLAALTLAVSAALQILSPLVCAGEPSPVDSKKTVVPPEPVDPWEFTLAMPGWLANTAGTVGLKGFNTGVYLSAETLLRHTDMIAAVSAEVRKGRFGMYGDLLYVSASDGIGTNGLVGKVAVRLDEYVADMELNYRVLEGPRGWLEVRAGVRYTNIYSQLTISPNDEAIDQASARFVDTASAALRATLQSDLRKVLDGKDPVLPIPPLAPEQKLKLLALIAAVKHDPELAAAIKAQAAATTAALKAAAQPRIDAAKNRVQKKIASALKTNLDRSFSMAEDWWDPYVGLSGRYNLGKAWYLTAKADIGGFGVGSQLTWQAYGALGCQVTRSIFVEAGYRYLYTDYDQNGFLYDVTMSGVQITAGITF